MSEIIKSRFEGMSDEEIIAKSFVDVVEEKQALERYHQDPALAENGMVKALAKITKGLEENFEQIVRARYPEGDTVN